MLREVSLRQNKVIEQTQRWLENKVAESIPVFLTELSFDCYHPDLNIKPYTAETDDTEIPNSLNGSWWSKSNSLATTNLCTKYETAKKKLYGQNHTIRHFDNTEDSNRCHVNAHVYICALGNCSPLSQSINQSILFRQCISYNSTYFF